LLTIFDEKVTMETRFYIFAMETSFYIFTMEEKIEFA